MDFKTICLFIVMVIAGFYCIFGDFSSNTPVENPAPIAQTEYKLPEPSKSVQTNDISVETEDTKPVVLFFYTDWCGGCKRFKPAYNAVKHRVVGYRYVEVNADKDSKLSQHFNIRSIPTVYIYDKKNNYKKKVNINNFEQELRNYLDSRK